MPLPQTLARSLGKPIPLSAPLPRTAATLSRSVGGTAGTLSYSLGLTMQIQLQSNWCWAATSSSVFHFFQPASSAGSQCDIVNAELHQSTCCVNGASSVCNQPWYLDRALTRVGHFKSMSNGPAAVPVLSTELGGKRPVCCRIGWAGGGGHFVAVDGLAMSATPFLTVKDPIYGTSSISYATFQTAYQGSGSWTHTYLTQP